MCLLNILSFPSPLTHSRTCTHTYVCPPSFLIQDLAFHVVWVIAWFIVSVEWIVAAKGIASHFNQIMNSSAADPVACKVSQDTNVQANIASVSRGGVALGNSWSGADSFGRVSINLT